MELVHVFPLNSGNYATATLIVAVAFAAVWMFRVVRSPRTKTFLINRPPLVQKADKSKIYHSGVYIPVRTQSQMPFILRYLLHQVSDLFNNSREAYESALRKYGHIIAVKRKGKVYTVALAYLSSMAKLFSASSSISLTIP